MGCGKKDKSVNKLDTSLKGIATDMDLIAKELQEEELIPGAYCQNYETFKSIYRFVERRLERIQMKAFIILLTLTDSSNNFAPLDTREERMAQLGEKIQDNLRMGDIYTQYSSCQYLVMVSDLSKDDVEIISNRICESFLKGNKKGNSEEMVIHHSYPLKPAGEMKRQ